VLWSNETGTEIRSKSNLNEPQMKTIPETEDEEGWEENLLF